MGNRDNNGRFARSDVGQIEQSRAVPCGGCSPVGYGVDSSKVRMPSREEELQKELEGEREHRRLADSQALQLKMVMPYFSDSLRQLSEGLFAWFRHQGFWPATWQPAERRFNDDLCSPDSKEREQHRLKKMEKLGLIVTEVAECMEAVRKDDGQNEAEELADVLVRLLDYAGGFDIELATAFEQKMLKNYARPRRHGKQF